VKSPDGAELGPHVQDMRHKLQRGRRKATPQPAPDSPLTTAPKPVVQQRLRPGAESDPPAPGGGTPPAQPRRQRSAARLKRSHNTLHGAGGTRSHNA
jgi:hypothetical protein